MRSIHVYGKDCYPHVRSSPSELESSILKFQILRINWNNLEILDKEKYYYRRLISEMINIKSQKNALNMQSELLQQTYV